MIIGQFLIEEKKMTLVKQLELEQEMLDIGTSRFMSSVDEKNDFDSAPVQSIMKKIILPFSEHLKLCISTVKSHYTRGAKPVLLFLDDIDSVHTVRKDGEYINKKLTVEELSFIVCRIIFNNIRYEPHKMVALASTIGNTINSNIKFDDRLSDSSAFRVGILMIDLLCDLFPDLLHYEYDMAFKDQKNKQYIVYPSEEYMTYIKNCIEEIAEISAVMYPMVHKPCEWDTVGQTGGFYSELLKSNIIKGRPLESDPKVSDIQVNSLNLIQGTPWQVNEDIYNVIKELETSKPLSLKKLFPHDVPDLEPMPYPDIEYKDMTEEQQQEKKAWYRKRTRFEEHSSAKTSIDLSRTLSMKQAKKFMNDDKIWFPHDRDYRGRAYNKCMTGLNTQGSDHQKALIKMGNARPVQTTDGARWMSINLANLAGHDKLKLDERYAWTVNNEDLIRDVVKDPIKCKLWHDWDKPLQGLACAIEYVKWLDDPERPIQTHVQLDGLCNGVQHLTALTRDHTVAPHVGLVYTEKRGDVYQFVCDGVITKIKDLDLAMAREWISSGLMTRSLSKTPVMTRAYGAKLYGVKEGIQSFIEDAKMYDHFEDYFKAGNWMGNQIWESMDESLSGPMAFMYWVQECAQILGKANKPMIWGSPVGMECFHSPFKTKRKRVTVRINGSTVQYILLEPTNRINTSKMSSSSSPNLIHSCDESHMDLTVDRCYDKGIIDYAMVHDSFGSHPDDAQLLLDSAKDAWVDMYSNDWIRIWYEQWCNQLGSNDLPRPDEFITTGTLDIRDVKQSDFFFG